MSRGESLDNAPDRYDLTTYIQSLQFKLRCYEASGDDFQRLFEEIIKRTRPEFMQIRPYGNIGDRKCDGLLYADGTIFQVYSPDTLKQSQLKKKINSDLDGAVRHWADILKNWIFVYNVRGGIAPDIPKILHHKQTQYPNIVIDYWSSHYLWEMARGLSLQQRVEILGAPVIEKLEPIGFKPHKNTICQFLQDIENDERFKYIGLFHTQQQIVLKEQYIPIQVTLERRYKHEVETFWGYAESEAELKRAYALKGFDEESQRSQVEWEEAKKLHKRIVVLADPGMGKSTLLKREAWLTAQVEIQKLFKDDQPIDNLVFPLFLKLSELAEHAQEIIDTIPALIHRDYPNTSPEILGLLKEKLKTGKCLLLLDALDEVPKEHRSRLKDKLDRFARNYPCSIICTSRIVGYAGAFLSGAKEVEIVPFTQKQTEQYIEIWFTNAAGYINDESVSAKELIRELRNKPQIRGLAQNPLLLSLLCSLYQEKGLTLPTRRTQVYKQAVDCMLRKWSGNRKPLSEGKIRAKARLLQELAYHLSFKGQEIFSLDELYDWIEEYLQGEKVPTVFRGTDTDELIAELSEEDGILQKLAREGDRYLFLHRTFQEYLTASYLNRASSSIALAREHFWEYEWHETLSLLAGLMENPIPLLQAIAAEKDDIFSTLLLLAGRSIAECPENSHPLIAEIIDKIYKFWQSYPNAGFIKSIVVAIGQANPQSCQKLQAALNDSNWGVRWNAAEALGNIGNTEAVPALVAALNDSDWDVRSNAAVALAKIDNTEAVWALVADLNQSDEYVKSNAAEVVGNIDNTEAVSALIAALKHPHEYVRSNAAVSLGDIGNSEAVPALIAALNDSNRWVRKGAAGALGNIGNSEEVSALIDALNDSDWQVRRNAAGALGNIGNSEAVPALIAALNDSDRWVRSTAVEALGNIGNSEAVPTLIAAFNDPDWDVRRNTAEALGNIGNEETLKKLINFLEIDIYRPDIFFLARTLAVRFSKENLPFIPVYPELVAHKQ